MFSKELENPQKSVKLDVPESAIAHDGEVDIKALNNAKTWQDLVFGCTHCKFKYESLDTLFKHMTSDVQKGQRGNKWLIKCPDCWKVFTRPSYLNHAQKHHTNLMFTCICCSKIYQSMGVLLKHYVDHHSDSPHSVFFCVTCGMYFSNLMALKYHKVKEHNGLYKKHLTVRNLNKNTPKSLRRKPGRPIGLTKKMLELRQVNSRRFREMSKDSGLDDSRKSERNKQKENDENKSQKSPNPSKSSEKSSETSSKSESDSGNSYDAEKRFHSPSKFVNRPCPRSRKPENIQAKSTSEANGKESYQKPCPKSRKELPNIQDKQQKTEAPRKIKPCPLSKKPKDFKPLENNEFPLKFTQTQLKDLVKNKVIADFNKVDDNICVQRIDNGAWTWLNSSEELKNHKRNSNDLTGVGKKINKRRLTCQ